MSNPANAAHGNSGFLRRLAYARHAPDHHCGPINQLQLQPAARRSFVRQRGDFVLFQHSRDFGTVQFQPESGDGGSRQQRNRCRNDDLHYAKVRRASLRIGRAVIGQIVPFSLTPYGCAARTCAVGHQRPPEKARQAHTAGFDARIVSAGALASILWRRSKQWRRWRWRRPAARRAARHLSHHGHWHLGHAH